jgi:formylglycine-generating enzyme required for sulfatase activity
LPPVASYGQNVLSSCKGGNLVTVRGEAAVSREILHQEGFYPEGSSGIFVGISTFDDERFSPVPFAVDDAVDLAWIFSLELGLVDAGRCVLALAGEPQKEISRARLASLLEAGAQRERPGLTKVYHLATDLSRSASPQGMFLLAGATHGLSEQGDDFLVAVDTQRNRLLRTAIAIPELFDTASTSTALRRLVLLDACRERLTPKRSLADPAMSQSFAAAIAKATGTTVLSGSTAGGYSYDDAKQKNGVFSGALVEGLLGAASADSRGFITVSTLADFAQQRVQAWVQRNRLKHEGLSRGIQSIFEEAAKHLPLAIDPSHARQTANYRRQREAALGKLRENLGFSPDAIIGAKLSAEIARYLQPSEPPPAAEKLMKALQRLDGDELSQRALRDVWREIRAQPVPRSMKALPVRRRGVQISAASTATASALRPPEPGELVVDSFGLRFRWIPGGTYTIGSPKSDPERYYGLEQRQVSIAGFWLAEVPMTQEFWKRQGLKNPSCFKKDAKCLVAQVSWFEAVVLANMLSKKAGLQPCYEVSFSGALGEESFKCSKAELKPVPYEGYRLPTEAEWDVAARAQAPGASYQARYRELEAIGWYSGNSGGRTYPVGEMAPNAWGLHYVMENVFEWTGDLYYPKDSFRVIRGGSWLHNAGHVCAPGRSGHMPDFRSDSLGFRFSLGRPHSAKERGAR